MYFVLLFVAAGTLELPAQTAAGSSPPGIAAQEELNRTELLNAYHNVREQLRATQTAIANEQLKSEAIAREQATAIAEKIEAMNATLAEERKNRQAETDRFDLVREQQQAEIRRSNRSVIWVASAFGTLGLLAMLGAAFLQWRAIKRMAETVDQRTQPPAPAAYALLPRTGDMPPGPPVALSTQGLISAIDRMERRIKELEHTTVQPLPALQPPQAKTHEAIA